jgi:dihydrofolate reductase
MNKTTISIIVAIARDRGIGFQNKLLVHLPPDLKHFKAVTMGHTIIMGQNTFESIGRPLPNRQNIILSLDKNFEALDCQVFDNIENALEYARQSEQEKNPENPEAFFIGGASIYAQSIKYADKLYVTLIDAQYPADTFFPDYSEFKNINKEEEQEYEGLKFKFLELTK